MWRICKYAHAFTKSGLGHIRILCFVSCEDIIGEVGWAKIFIITLTKECITFLKKLCILLKSHSRLKQNCPNVDYRSVRTGLTPHHLVADGPCLPPALETCGGSLCSLLLISCHMSAPSGHRCLLSVPCSCSLDKPSVSPGPESSTVQRSLGSGRARLLPRQGGCRGCGRPLLAPRAQSRLQL